MEAPLISIIVPCYNQAQYLNECLQSVLEQTFVDWECIIVNDGSPDDTENVALNWTAKDNRFIYLKKENGGLSSARNAGIEMAKGEWILPLDCDDKISEQYLQLACDNFSKNPTIIYCEAEYFGLKKGIIKLIDYNFQSILLWNCIFCSAFFKKNDWADVGGYDENMKHGYEDWEFWISILKNKNAEVIKLKKICFFYRIKGNSMLTELTEEKQELMITHIVEKHNSLYYDSFGNYYSAISELSSLRKINAAQNKILSSKKYLFFKKITILIDKLRK